MSRQSAMSRRVAVAAPSTSSAAAALRVAELGGGAVDAAVAAVLVAMVTEPGIVSLAGGAFITVWPAGEPAVTVDAYVAMPGLGREHNRGAARPRSVRTEYGGGVTMTAGHASVAVPGAVAGLDLAVSRWGSLPWREVVAPALAAARDGFILGSAAGYYLPYVRDNLFAWDAETAAALRQVDGRPVATGDRMIVPGLADTVELLADEGARTLYEGELADRISADMRERGGLVTEADLAAYRPLVRPALGVIAGQWELRTNPPPAIGGTVVAAMMTLLADPAREPWSPGDVSRLVEVQRWVLDARRDSLDVADDRGAAAADLLREVGWHAPGSASTVHVSVVDDRGTSAAITASSGYGSGATVPGTGLWLNNCLGELELNRGAPLEPGSRLRSNMAPTVARARDGSVLAIGSPGADRITTALVQVLAPFALAGASLQDAVDRPRLHLAHLDDDRAAQLEAEEDLLLPSMDLPARRHHAHSMYFGGVAAALCGPDGRLSAAADPRRAGVATTSQRPTRRRSR